MLDTEAVLTALSRDHAVSRMPGNTHTGIIIALSVPPKVARQIAVGSEPAGEMHLTLAYLGDATKLSGPAPERWVELAGALERLAAAHPALTAHFAGSGTFAGVGDGGEDAQYLKVASPGLAELREACVKVAGECGAPASQKHPNFKPHVTLAYGPAHPLPQPPSAPFAIGALELWFAGHRLAFPFHVAKAAQPAPGDTKAAQALYAQLTADLLGMHAGDSHLRRQCDALEAGHRERFEGLMQAVPAPRGSALEDAALHHAAEAEGARRVRAGI